MTSSPLLKSLLAGLRRKRVREGNSGDCCGFEERGGWKRELREWEERGSRRKEAKEKDESFRVEERSRRISEEEVGGGHGGGSEESKKKKRGGEGLCSFEKATSMVGTVARPLSVEQRCQIDAARALRHDAIFLHTTSKRLEALEQASQLLFQAYNSHPQTHLSSPLLDLSEQHLFSAVSRVQDALKKAIDGAVWVRYADPESLRTPLESLGMMVILSDDLMHVTSSPARRT
ncbi:hypothetical protein BDY24DRAFT_436372 [Mrakia frigida]|uniref:uncharacterized protein n=1 Tax=Mrakia frigida TaxID=29902 RepID=UPI003FCBF22D